MSHIGTEPVKAVAAPAPKLPRGLAIRLAVALLVFGALVAALISGNQLYTGYRHDIRDLERSVNFITGDQRASIESAVWQLDEGQINSLLEGWRHIPHVEFISIETESQLHWSIGEQSSLRRLTRHVDLERELNGKTIKIGQMTVVMSEDDVIRQRLEHFSTILLGNALAIGLLASFALFVFHYLVTRHLQRLSRFLLELDPSRPTTMLLQLARKPGKIWRPDELDLVTGAVNGMVANLRTSQAESAAATARLSEREAFLDAVVSHAGAAIDVIDRDTLQLLEVNDSACTLLGYSRDELLQRRLSDLQADFAEDHLRELLEVMVDGAGGAFITRYRRKDGQIIDIDLTMRLIKLEGRRLLVSVWSDITRQKLMEQELAAARDDLRSITENTSAALWTADATGHFLYANPAACALTGYTLEQMRQKSIPQLLVESERERLPAEILTLKTNNQSVVGEWTLRRHDGGTVAVELTNQQLPDGRFLAIGRDITERLRSDEKLRRAAGVFANSLEGIMITNAAGVIVDVNPAFCDITGYSHEEAVGKSPSILGSGHHSPDFFAEMWRELAEHDRWRGEVWNRKKTGEVFVEMLSISAVRDAAGNVKEYVAVSSDISRLKQHEDELDRIAHYDPLTGLANRRLLDDRLRLAKARAERDGRRLAVCFIDLDGFKPINDEFGHATGDHVLVTIAQRFEQTLRGGDTVARMGGDEFVLLLGDLDTTEECTPALDRILQLIAEPVQLHGQAVSVSASIGVTLFPLDSADTDTLLRHADQAMYVAKELGKNRVHFFDAENDRRVAAHREALFELQAALANDEFVLYYQPKVDLRNGEVIGAEALIRWRKPDGEIIPPGVFLPTLDGSSLEIKVSMWVIESTMAQIVRWKAAKLPARVSANLVASHLQQHDFLEWLELLLACYPTLEAGDLNLEILESAAIGDIEVVAERLAAVRALGVGVSLDDFGTGYSSLAYFRRLPIDTLKIDQGFVRDMLDDKEALGIVDSVVRLAKVFNRRVIAEGVETMEHWRTLLTLDCDFGQGYGIARPMPAEQFPAWVAQWREHGPWREFVREET